MASLFRMYSQISKLYTPPRRNFKNFPVFKNIIFNIIYIYTYILSLLAYCIPRESMSDISYYRIENAYETCMHAVLLHYLNSLPLVFFCDITTHENYIGLTKSRVKMGLKVVSEQFRGSSTELSLIVSAKKKKKKNSPFLQFTMSVT